jgi:spermidine synthase
LYYNRFQLATREVFYSDGDKYIPALETCSHFKAFLPQVQQVLVLGTGLGSLVQVIDRKGYKPFFTLVELDKVVLKWALELVTAEAAERIVPVCEDAATYMRRNKRQYNLIFIDIFNSNIVPAFVYSEEFLLQCRESVAPGGHLAFNYMVIDKKEWEAVQRVFSIVFPGYKVISRGVNKILVV